ncbi:MAG TPA: hypothetical protein VF519_17780 [Mycobacteriales bacterium]|jgi:hypothetical protein
MSSGRKWQIATVVMLVLLSLFRYNLERRDRARERERREEAARILAALATATPGPVHTTMTPAPPVAPTATPVGGRAQVSHEGWAVDWMTAWCADGRWAGEASVRATTRTPRTWAFAFTLEDGPRDVGSLRGEHDHTAFMEPATIRLSSSDACADGTFGYRWSVV